MKDSTFLLNCMQCDLWIKKNNVSNTSEPTKLYENDCIDKFAMAAYPTHSWSIC